MVNGQKDASSAGTHLKLAPGILIGADAEALQAKVLLPSAGIVHLNRHALAILELCDGSRSRDRVIVDAILRSPATLRAADVVQFLDAARARGWIVDSEP